MRTKPDDILEGEERYTLSLVSADNNGDISATEGDATIIILADEGASGIISIATHSRVAYIGEPVADYDGISQLELIRDNGIFGTVTVTWQVIPRDLTAFVQTQGDVTFEDGQASVWAVLQAGDDATPEKRKSYNLELTAATGGASINAARSTAEIVMVASDYPHGLFEFIEPTQISVNEEDSEVRTTELNIQTRLIPNLLHI